MVFTYARQLVQNSSAILGHLQSIHVQDYCARPLSCMPSMAFTKINYVFKSPGKQTTFQDQRENVLGYGLSL
jgi:hypothetical protein